MRLHGLVYALMLSVVLSGASALAANAVYVNDRFGTSVAYPGDVFTTMQAPPDNDDGQTWLSPDGATLTVFAEYNVFEETPKSLVAGAKADSSREITYSRYGPDWAVVSGFDGDDVFYERYLFGAQDVIHTVIIRYPKTVKAKYDPLVGAIASSLKGP